MIPIQSICPDCHARLNAALDQLQDKGKTMLHAFCTHNKVTLSLTVLPGGVADHWMLTPAETAEEAKANAEETMGDAQFLQTLHAALAAQLITRGTA